MAGFTNSRRVRRGIATIASATVLSLALAACSGGSSVGDATKVDNANEGLPVVGETLKFDPNKLVNDGEPIQLEWWAWAEIEKFQAIADAYQEIHPNVDIVVKNQPWDDFWTKLPLELKGDKGPALFNVHNSQHNNIIGYMAPYDIPVEELTADYTGVEPHIVDGKVHYIDLGMMSGAMYYNKDMWAAAGLTDADIPTTWDEFREVAKKLTVRDGDKLTQAGFNFNGGGQAIQFGLAYQQGQNLFAEDGKTPTVNNEANLKTIDTLTEIYADGSGDANFGTSGTDSFGQGQSAMTYAWGWYSGSLNADYPDLNWGVFQTPVPNADEVPYAYDRYNGEPTFGINKNAPAEEQAVAQDFLRFFLTNSEGIADISKAFGIYPAYKPLAGDPSFDDVPAISAFADAERYIWPGPIPATFENSFATMWEDILYNGVDKAEALAKAQETIETDLGSVDFTSPESSYLFYEPSGN